MFNALGQTPLHTAISRSSTRCAKKLRHVLFNERSTEPRNSPVSPPPQPSREPTPDMPSSRARMLFRKYGIKETIPKPWHPSQKVASQSSPQLMDKLDDTSQGHRICLKDTNENSPASSHSEQTRDNVQARRATSAKLPLTQKVLWMSSRGRSAETEKSSHWARIPKAKILLRLSCRDNSSLLGFRCSSDSVPFESKLKVADFRLANQSQKAPDCLAPHPSPESLSPPELVTSQEESNGNVVAVEEFNEESQPGSGGSASPGKYDRQSSSGTQYSSFSSRSRAEGDR